MDVREKLVELVHNARMNALWHNAPNPSEYITDMLMEDGVTVQDKTEISDEFLEQLRNTPVTILQEEPAVEVVQEWISVKDRLPKGGAIVLCNTDYFVEVLQWDERADMWVDQYRNYRKNYVTHWMPLPQPPKGE